MKFLVLLMIFISEPIIARASSPDDIANSVKMLCTNSAEGHSSLLTVTGHAQGGIVVRLANGQFDGSATFTEKEWEGVQQVLQKDLLVDNRDFRQCTTTLTSLFLEKFVQIKTNFADDIADCREKSSVNYEHDDYQVQGWLGFALIPLLEAKNAATKRQAQREADSIAKTCLESKGYIFDGYGERTFESGDRYVGNWKGGRFDGRGSYYYKVGGHYDGDWQSGEKSGHGINIYSDNCTYEGEFLHNKRNGKGKLSCNNGTSYEGGWKDDKKDGVGTFLDTNGTIYVGQFKDDFENGKGSAKFKDGTFYTGYWKDNFFEGDGAITYADGSKYVGEFRKGNRDGRGKYISVKRDVRIGIWSSDKFVE